MTSYATSAGSARAPLPAMSAEQVSFLNHSRMISRLETSSTIKTTDPEVLLPALHSLENKLTSLKNRVAFSASSRHPSATDVDQLIIKTQGLQRQLERTLLVTASHQPSGLPFISTSAMGRFLEESIQSQPTTRIVLPPAPRLIVNEGLPVSDASEKAAAGDLEKRPLEEEAEAEEMAEYEQAAHMRKRRGYTHSQEGDPLDEKGRSKLASSSTSEVPEKSTSTASAAPAVNQTTHENLSSELLRMAGLLKSQSISFSSALERDRKLLESTDEQLTKNLDLMTRTRGRLGEYAHKARGMGWLTLGTIVVVVITWIVMFFIIRLT